MIVHLPGIAYFDPAPARVVQTVQIGASHRAVHTVHFWRSEGRAYLNMEVFGPGQVRNFNTWAVATGIDPSAFSPTTPSQQPMQGQGAINRPAQAIPVGMRVPPSSSGAPGVSRPTPFGVFPDNPNGPPENAIPFGYIQSMPNLAGWTQTNAVSLLQIRPMLGILWAWQSPARDQLIIASGFNVWGDQTSSINFLIAQYPN